MRIGIGKVTFVWLATVATLLTLPFGEITAQRPTAAITGFVRQPAETAVDGADVIVRNTTTGYEYRGSTSSSGQYWVRGLPPGSYDVTVRRIGMQPVSRSGVELAVGRTATIHFVMGTAAVQLEAIEVVGSAPVVETTQSDIAFRIDREMLAVLPEESRQFIDLAQLVPGATTASTEGRAGFGGAGVSVGALNTQSLGVVIDGADFTEALFGELSGSIPLLATQEFEVIQTQYSAQFGRAASGVINAVTRRGGNETVFEGFGLYRNKSLNALGEFETAKPNFNRSHWGVAFGGPIVRDKTHFFTAFERRVQNDFVTTNTNGVFPAFEGTFKTPFTDNLLFARLDHRVNNRHELTLRLSGETGDRTTLVNELGGAAASDHASRRSQNMYSALLTHR